MRARGGGGRVRLSKAYRDQYDHQESRTEGRDESVTQRAILCRKQSGEPGENCCSRPTHGEYPSPRGKFQHERKQKRINRPQTQPSECGAHPDCCRRVCADEQGHRGSEAPESQTHYPAAANNRQQPSGKDKAAKRNAKPEERYRQNSSCHVGGIRRSEEHTSDL